MPTVQSRKNPSAPPQTISDENWAYIKSVGEDSKWKVIDANAKPPVEKPAKPEELKGK